VSADIGYNTMDGFSRATAVAAPLDTGTQKTRIMFLSKERICIVVGLSCMWLWLYLVLGWFAEPSAVPSLSIPADSTSSILTEHVSSAVVMLLVAVLTRFFKTSGKLLLVIGALLGVAIAVSIPLSSIQAEFWLLAVMGLGYSFLMAGWMSVLVTNTYREMTSLISGSWVILVFLYFALNAFPYLVGLTGALIAPLGSLGAFLLCTRSASLREPEGVDVQTGTEAVRERPYREFIGRNLLCSVGATLLYACAMGMLTQVVMANTPISWPSGAIFIAAVFLLYGAITKRSLNPTTIMVITALMTCVAIALTLVLSIDNLFLMAVAMAAFWSLFMLVLVNSCHIANQGARQKAMPSFSWMGGYLLLFALGKFLAWVASFDTNTILIVSVLLIVIAVLLTLLATGGGAAHSQPGSETESAVAGPAATGAGYAVAGAGSAVAGLVITGAASGSAAFDALVVKNAITDREKAVFRLLAKGYSLKKVSDELAISQSTAKTHRHSIYQKLDVRNRQELIDFVEKHTSLS
jgi:DNA-binding CsgD family transcriptional regulator